MITEIHPDRLRMAIGVLEDLDLNASQFPILDREIKMARDILAILRGEEDVFTLAAKAKAANDEFDRRHPIIVLLRKFFHPEE